MIVAGVGFRSGVDGAALAGLVAQALAAAGRAGTPLAALATLESISHAPGFADAASRLGTRALALPHEALLARDAECPTRSERSLAAHGLGSVAEAAALAAAGPGSRLVSARIANATATCALAAPSLPVGEGGLSSEARKAGRGPGGGFASNLGPHPTSFAFGSEATLPSGEGCSRPSLPVGEGGLASEARKAGWGPGGDRASAVGPHPTPVADAPGATLPDGEGFLEAFP